MEDADWSVLNMSNKSDCVIEQVENGATPGNSNSSFVRFLKF